jgi:hypothetical protein
MDDTKTMFRAILNGQSAMKAELLTEIRKVDEKIEKLDKRLSTRLTEVETNLTNRIDKLGLQLAKLEDDSPTRGEFEGRDERVEKLEQSAASI